MRDHRRADARHRVNDEQVSAIRRCSVAPRRSRQVTVATIELGFFAVLVYLLVPRFGTVGRAITDMHWWVVPIAVFLEAASLAAYAELDLCALRGVGVNASRPLVYRVNISGTALGKILPGGTAAAMPFTTRMLEAEGAEPALAVAALAGAGLLASVILAVLLPVAGLVALISGDGGVLASSVLGVAVAIGIVAILVRPALRDPDKIGAASTRFARVLARGPLRRYVHPQRLGASVARAASALLHVASNGSVLRRAASFAAGSWILDFAALAAVALSIGHGPPLAGLPLAYVVGQLAAAVPLTPGGVGVIEATMTGALVAQGSTAAAATVTVLGWRLVSHWLPIAVGLSTYLLRSRHRVDRDSPTSSVIVEHRPPPAQTGTPAAGATGTVTPDPGSATHDAHRERFRDGQASDVPLSRSVDRPPHGEDPIVTAVADELTGITNLPVAAAVPDAELAVVTHGLTKTYGDVRAVIDVDMRIERGAIVGLLGPNGSGKTTLIRMLSTLLRPTSGSALVGGFDIGRQPADVRRCIGLTGQFAAVDEFLTGRENIRMMGRLAGMSATQASTRADELLSSFGLEDASDRHLSTYSGGMRRRLDLALSLTGHPAIVFLDEPTTGLDPRSRFAMWEVIESLLADGTTVLLCTQYLEEADRLAERVVILDEGRVVAEGRPADLRRQVGGIVVELDLHDLAQRADAISVLAPTTTSPIAGRANDPHLRIPVSDAERLPEVVRLLDGASIPFHGLALHEPTLDDVFLALTGHATKQPEEDTK